MTDTNTTHMPSAEAREFARKHFDDDIDAAVFLDAFAAPYKAAQADDANERDHYRAVAFGEQQRAEHAEAARDAMAAQVAALYRVAADVAVYADAPKTHEMDDGEAGVVCSWVELANLRTALTDTQDTADRFRRDAEARGMEMAAERLMWRFGRGFQLLELIQMAASHRTGTSEGETK